MIRLGIGIALAVLLAITYVPGLLLFAQGGAGASAILIQAIPGLVVVGIPAGLLIYFGLRAVRAGKRDSAGPLAEHGPVTNRPGARPWTKNRRLLRSWILVHAGAWLGGLLVAFYTPAPSLGWWLFALSAVPYFVALVFAFRIQRELNKAGLYKPGAWQVIAGGLIFKPWFLGIIITSSVLSVVRRIDAQLDSQVS